MLSERQRKAIGLINTDREEKDIEIDNLLDKRIDVQNETNFQKRTLRSVTAEMQELKAEVE